MKLTLIRSATIKLEYGGTCFLFDPAFAEKLSGPSFAGKSKNPLVDMPISREAAMQGVDFVIVSHNHSDHFDRAAQLYIDKNMPIICQPQEEVHIKSMGFNGTIPIENFLDIHGISVQRTPTKHGSGEVLKEMGAASGFILSTPSEPKIYWPGDTVMFDDVQRILEKEKPDIVITHSAGAQWKGVRILFDEKETIDICKTLPQSKIVAVHLNAYDHATVFRDSLRNYARAHQIDDCTLLIPEDGETIHFTSNTCRNESL